MFLIAQSNFLIGSQLGFGIQDTRMGWQNFQDKTMELLTGGCGFLAGPFHILTVTLLGLLLPLSFLLLARLTFCNYISIVSSDALFLPSSFLFSLFRFTNPVILYCLISVVSVATLIHGLTGKIALISESTVTVCRPTLYTAWILLCTLQICVGLGIEGTIAAGIDGSRSHIGRSLFSRLIFFLGLHETMLYWSRTVVKPVVDDTVFGEPRDERWVQRVAAAVSFGGLWWWRLRDEFESLVLVAESKKQLTMGLILADFIGWWLYYLTVAIGMVRIVKCLLWVGAILICRRVRFGVNGNSDDSPENEDKV